MGSNLLHNFTFAMESFEDGTFQVVRFEGVEGIGICYEFDILLLTYTDIEPNLLFGKKSTLTVNNVSQNKERNIHGTLCRVQQKTSYHEAIFFEVKLVPNLWYLQHTNYYQIFIHKSLEEIIASILDYAMMHKKIDYEFRLKNSYEPLEYVTQYNESHFNFMLRWMEKYGLFFYFVQEKDRERLIICDENHFLDEEKEFEVKYQAETGTEEAISHLEKHINSIVANIIYQDYAYEHPSSVINETLQVHRDGAGDMMSFNDNILSYTDLKRFAKVHNEIEQCKYEMFVAETTVCEMYAGCIYTLANTKDAGEKSLVTTSKHYGNQHRYLECTLPSKLRKEQQNPLTYFNELNVIRTDIPYRMALRAKRPKVYGTISAKIDAEGEGKYAQLDKWGRYKVKMPFDLSDKGSGKASTWIRMGQASAGERMGMHFPLHKGTEVLIGFIGGDPDRPYIDSAIPNMLTPSPINDASATQSKVVTDKKTAITLEDLDGNEHMRLEVPTHECYTDMGWVSIGSMLQKGIETHAPNQQTDISQNLFTKVGGTINTKASEKIDDYNSVNASAQYWKETSGYKYQAFNTGYTAVGMSVTAAGMTLATVGAGITIVGIAGTAVGIAGTAAGVNLTLAGASFAKIGFDSAMAAIKLETDKIELCKKDISSEYTAVKKKQEEIETNFSNIASNQTILSKSISNLLRQNDLMLMGND